MELNLRNITFPEVRRGGYDPEDVHAFLQEVADEFDKLNAEKAQVEENLYILAAKVEEYREQETALQAALINAQRMGESIVQEAKKKAEQITKAATAQAENTLEGITASKEREERHLAKMRREITVFRNTVLELYREHIDLLSALPSDEEEPAQEQAEPDVNTVLEIADETPFEPAQEAQDEPAFTLDEEIPVPQMELGSLSQEIDEVFEELEADEVAQEELEAEDAQQEDQEPEIYFTHSYTDDEDAVPVDGSLFTYFEE